MRHIEVFEAVMKTGSVSAAATLINVSQPAVTKTLQHAESQLGFKLFRRIKGRLYPTPEATVLYREVGKVSSAIETVRTLARNLKSGDQGHIRIAATPVLAQEVVPIAIHKFRTDNAGITCAMETNHWKEVFEAVLTNGVDVAFAAAPPDHPAIQQHPVHQGEMVVAFPRSQAPRRERITLKDLDEYDFVSLMESVNPVSNNLKNACEAVQLNLKSVIQVQTHHVALWFVAQGAGVAVIDQFTAVKAPRDQVALRRLSPAMKFDIAVLFAKDRPPSVYTEKFIKYFVAACQEMHAKYERLIASSS
ncbi:MAG: LysR family transcriptional regulator [Betaproteobacteria bacterium]|nr:MAG: LysR family transcriptional regulator [Betaproteobacteria bacterium]